MRHLAPDLCLILQGILEGEDGRGDARPPAGIMGHVKPRERPPMSAEPNDTRREGVSKKTDELASELLGKALDVLAVGEELDVLLAVADADGEVSSYEFADDGPEECLEGAHKKAAESADAVRYAIAYRGAIADETGAYQDAVILEFGERGYRSYSAFSLVDVTGDEDTFGWTEPQPAGEVEPLL